MALSPGQILANRYRIVKLLGQGGFGAVYRVWDINLDRPLALKENLDVSPEAQRQFKREAQILFDLLHPNLPRVIDHFVLAGQGQYLVMEYVDGEDLEKVILKRAGPLAAADVLDWIGQICDALDYLHSQTPPIIHRDIKPANIKIVPASGPNSPAKAVLVDFGIAKVFDPKMVTTAGARAVTPGFSPPEQYGQGATDARSDIYALGATCYTLLSGQAPPDSVDVLTMRSAPPLPVQNFNSQVSPHVGDALEKAMNLDANARYISVGAFKAALRGTAAPSTNIPATQLAAPRSAIPRKTLRRDYLVYALAGLAGLVVLIWGLSLLLRPLAAAHAEPTRPLATPGILPEASSTATADGAPGVVRPSPTTPADLPLEPGENAQSLVDGMELVYIPSGEFVMGSEPLDIGAKADQMPLHRVYLDDFWMDKTEVTNAMYALCVDAGSCNPPARSSSATVDAYYGETAYQGYPVIWVSWYDASDYCAWAGRRLPSEAEWERAARGDSNNNYPWGDTLSSGDHANFCDLNCPLETRERAYDDGYADTAPVSSFPSGASPYHILNLAGNVWEWVADWYEPTYYALSVDDNPTGPDAGEYRVLRGGSFESSPAGVRSANRYHAAPDVAALSFGFRCTLSAAPVSQTFSDSQWKYPTLIVFAGGIYDSP